MLKNILILISILFFEYENLKSQNSDSISAEIVPFQISFVSPVGTNGLDCGAKTNIFSLNILSGYSGGVKGFEVGSIANIVAGNMGGFQVAGVSNIVKDDVNGIQIAGFGNICSGMSNGMQIAGFSNVSRKSVFGMQIAGFSNFAGKNASAAQIAGFSNVTVDTLFGFQLAGFSNLAETVRGTQLGFINIAKNIKGSQIGFINISDSIDSGIPVGFFCYSKNGYHKIEISGSETFHAVVSYKTGVEKFYNIFSVGMNFDNDQVYTAFGYGLGSESKIGKISAFNYELLNFALFDIINWNLISYDLDYDFVNITKLSLTLSLRLFKHFEIFGGITANAAVSYYTDAEGLFIPAEIIPKKVYTWENSYFRADFYPGFTAGIRI